MNVTLRQLSIADYDPVMVLWKSSEGMGFSNADSRENIAAFLERNAGLSLVAEADGQIVGAVLCGHDGRRGFFYHLAVDRQYRRRGIGQMLAARCLALLQERGIHKVHIVVFAENTEAQTFWKQLGWSKRDDLMMMSKQLTT
ncbi:MAG: GNAT family N-acetyltransferase [Verrucomicrobia bacterium]|nr:MAG: GNAT family N-acetyltransferase [Verrucomicrobiota bacterium]